MSGTLAQSARLHPSVVPLGKIAKHSATPPQRSGKRRQKTQEEIADARAASARMRFRLQEAAARIAPHERVFSCCRLLVNGETHVELVRSPETGSAHYRCLETCGSVWLCPVCAAKVAEGRREELAAAVVEVERLGGQVLHVTFTIRHSRRDDLRELLSAFLTAYGKMTSWRGYKNLKSGVKMLGAVRALEVTHGSNGWHPHNHVLLVLDRPLGAADLKRFELVLFQLWRRAAEKMGLSMNEHGLKVQATKGAIADYIAKYGRDPVGPVWGPESELAKGHMKQAREEESSTPWDLLRRYCEGETQAGRLWSDYAAVFKGRQQLVWSNGLRALLGLEDAPSDAELAGQVPADVEHVLWVKLEDWRLVVRYKMRGVLLNCASTGDPDYCRGLLDELRERYRQERRDRLVSLPPPPLVLLPPVQLELMAGD